MDPLYLFIFTRIASTEVFLVVSALILTYLLVRYQAKHALTFFLSALGLILSTHTLKESLQVPRPEQALIETIGYAFPSGHASGATFIAITICYLVRKSKAPIRYVAYGICILSAVAIGYSRVHFGVHTPLQVIIGSLLGAFWACIFIAFSKQQEKTSRFPSRS